MLEDSAEALSDLRLPEFSIPAAPPDFRSGFIAIVGRPNVGKSTLMNQLIGQKIAITSPVAQTTRNRLRGILTTPSAQIIFVDTPGIHKPHHRLGEVLVQNAESAIRSADVVLFVVDGSASLGGGDRFIADLLSQATIPTILGVNKIDRIPTDEGGSNLETYHQLAEANSWGYAEFSALNKDGLEHLERSLVESLEIGPYYYPPDLVTDRPERFIMGELIREQVLLLTREEVPHSVAVSIDLVEEKPKITNVLATIYVERNSQKGILIGKGGSMLKNIGTAAREQMQKLIEGKVYLELFVKVTPKWRQSKAYLAQFGYQVET